MHQAECLTSSQCPDAAEVHRVSACVWTWPLSACGEQSRGCRDPTASPAGLPGLSINTLHYSIFLVEQKSKNHNELMIRWERQGKEHGTGLMFHCCNVPFNVTYEASWVFQRENEDPNWISLLRCNLLPKNPRLSGILNCRNVKVFFRDLLSVHKVSLSKFTNYK